MPKQLPLQAVGNRTSHKRATAFEDDDEDEYEIGDGIRRFRLHYTNQSTKLSA